VKGPSAEHACTHNMQGLYIERTGSRLHPQVWIVLRCLTCDTEFDRKKATRGMDVYSKRVDK
jgi:hypothetical protein